MNKDFFIEEKYLEDIQSQISNLSSVRFRWNPFKMPNGICVLNMYGNEEDLERFGEYVSQLKQGIQNAD